MYYLCFPGSEVWVQFSWRPPSLNLSVIGLWSRGQLGLLAPLGLIGEDSLQVHMWGCWQIWGSQILEIWLAGALNSWPWFLHGSLLPAGWTPRESDREQARWKSRCSCHPTSEETGHHSCYGLLDRSGSVHPATPKGRRWHSRVPGGRGPWRPSQALSTTVGAPKAPRMLLCQLPLACLYVALGQNVVPNKRPQKQPALKVKSVFPISTENKGECGFLLETPANSPSHPEWHCSLSPPLPELPSIDGGGFLGNSNTCALPSQGTPQAGTLWDGETAFPMGSVIKTVECGGGGRKNPSWWLVKLQLHSEAGCFLCWKWMLWIDWSPLGVYSFVSLQARLSG